MSVSEEELGPDSHWRKEKYSKVFWNLIMELPVFFISGACRMVKQLQTPSSTPFWHQGACFWQSRSHTEALNFSFRLYIVILIISSVSVVFDVQTSATPRTSSRRDGLKMWGVIPTLENVSCLLPVWPFRRTVGLLRLRRFDPQLLCPHVEVSWTPNCSRWLN